MSVENKPPTPFKTWFDETRYQQIARELSAIESRFDRKKFLTLTLEGLDRRELMDRLRQTAIAAEAALPGSYRDKLAVLREVAPRLKHSFVTISFCDFVARYGLDDFEHSMDTLKFLTPLGSAEFAVRPFIQRDHPRALAIMLKWARDENEHVRRLASEGSRPRLPWGTRLSAIVANPGLTAPIIEILKTDPALYVRKSVANHLNDIAKDHPDWALDHVEAWDKTNADIDWIVRRALRTLIKQGHPRALALCGVVAGSAEHVRVKRFSATPVKLKLGEPLQLDAELTCTTNPPVKVVIDYVVHYVKARGKTSAKVFKWTETTLTKGTIIALKKRQMIRDYTTRTHAAGLHRIELQVNGRRLAETSFQLKL